MKFNWKLILAVIILVGATVWGVQSLQVQNYTGTDVSFAVGTGPVSITNQTDVSIPAQLIGNGTRSFSIIDSSLTDISTSSERQGSGATATQLIEFDLPPGVNEFTVARGNDVNFSASADKPILATVVPLNAASSQTTLLFALIGILGSIAYIAVATKSLWLKRFFPSKFAMQDTQPSPTIQSGGQGENLRSFGDNRAKTGD